MHPLIASLLPFISAMFPASRISELLEEPIHEHHDEQACIFAKGTILPHACTEDCHYSGEANDHARLRREHSIAMVDRYVVVTDGCISWGIRDDCGDLYFGGHDEAFVQVENGALVIHHNGDFEDAFHPVVEMAVALATASKSEELLMALARAHLEAHKMDVLHRSNSLDPIPRGKKELAEDQAYCAELSSPAGEAEFLANILEAFRGLTQAA